MNRRQAVPEFVGDARGQFAEPRKRLLEAQLLFQLNHIRQIRKQTDGTCALGTERRHRHAEVRGPSHAWNLKSSTRDRAPALKAFRDRIPKWRRSDEQIAIVSTDGVSRDLEQFAARRVQDLDAACVVCHQQAGCETFDDLTAQLL